MHVGEGKNTAAEMITRFLKVGARSVEHSLKGRANIAVDYFVYILLNFGPRSAGLGKDISIISITYPVVFAGVIKGVGFADRANEAEMELGLFRHVPDNPGDLEGCIVRTYHQRPANDVGAVEIAAGGTFVDHDGMRVVEEAVLGSPLIRGRSEDLEDRGVGEDEVMLQECGRCPSLTKLVAQVAEPDHLLDLWIGSNERGAEKFGPRWWQRRLPSVLFK